VFIWVRDEDNWLSLSLYINDILERILIPPNVDLCIHLIKMCCQYTSQSLMSQPNQTFENCLPNKLIQFFENTENTIHYAGSDSPGDAQSSEFNLQEKKYS
ncbi:hypothetical protein KSF78_0008526, partial [Schistosoma japonicum]